MVLMWDDVWMVRRHKWKWGRRDKKIKREGGLVVAILFYSILKPVSDASPVSGLGCPCGCTADEDSMVSVLSIVVHEGGVERGTGSTSGKANGKAEGQVIGDDQLDLRLCISPPSSCAGSTGKGLYLPLAQRTTLSSFPALRAREVIQAQRIPFPGRSHCRDRRAQGKGKSAVVPPAQ